MDPQSAWQADAVALAPLSAGEVERRAARFERTITWRNRRELVASAVGVLALGWIASQARAGALVTLAGCALLLAGNLFVAFRIVTRAPWGAHAKGEDVASPTAAHLASLRAALGAQRDLLHGAWRWYVLPFLPGFIVFVLATPLETAAPTLRLWVGSFVSLVIGSAVFGGVAWLNRRAARALDAELRALA